jgi:hypothetical protein
MIEDEAQHIVKCRKAVLHAKSRCRRPVPPKTPAVIRLGPADLEMVSLDVEAVVSGDVERRSRALTEFAERTSAEAADRLAQECEAGRKRLDEINETLRKDGAAEEKMPQVSIVSPRTIPLVDALFEAVKPESMTGERSQMGVVVALECDLEYVCGLGDYATIEALRYPVRRAFLLLSQWYRHAHPTFIDHSTLVVEYDMAETPTKWILYVRLVRPNYLNKQQYKHLITLTDDTGEELPTKGDDKPADKEGTEDEDEA